MARYRVGFAFVFGIICGILTMWIGRLLIAENKATPTQSEQPAEVGSPLVNGPLIFSIESRSNISEIDRLIEEYGGINDIAIDGRPAIVVAAESKRSDVVSLLIKHGASVAARTPKGAQALHVAASADVEMCKVLIDAGADINSREQLLGYTPLHFAVHYGNAEIVEFLLSKGADPCVESKLGFSAVRVARNLTEGDDKQRILEKLRQYAVPSKCW